MSMNWTCPFCDRDTVLTDLLMKVEQNIFTVPNKYGHQMTNLQFLACPNPSCREFSLKLVTGNCKVGAGNAWQYSETPKVYPIIPSSSAKPFPEYIPIAIRQDYQEACAIKTLSPKASATLARRCLQGMIRDYWEVKEKRLADAIKAIEHKVDSLTWKAIDAVRKVGNIGAHMEMDINLIVDVEPDEAERLIKLIELLIKDWYLARQQREENFNAIVSIGDAKKQAQTANKAPLP